MMTISAMDQYDENLEAAVMVCVYLYVYLGWFDMVAIRWPEHWSVCVLVCLFLMVQFSDNLENTVLVCLLVCV